MANSVSTNSSSSMNSDPSIIVTPKRSRDSPDDGNEVKKTPRRDSNGNVFHMEDLENVLRDDDDELNLIHRIDQKLKEDDPMECDPPTATGAIPKQFSTEKVYAPLMLAAPNLTSPIAHQTENRFSITKTEQKNDLFGLPRRYDQVANQNAFNDQLDLLQRLQQMEEQNKKLQELVENFTNHAKPANHNIIETQEEDTDEKTGTSVETESQGRTGNGSATSAQPPQLEEPRFFSTGGRPIEELVNVTDGNTLTMAIFPSDYPSKIIDEKLDGQLNELITTKFRARKRDHNGEQIHIVSTTVQNGVMIVVCKTIRTASWLSHTVYGHEWLRFTDVKMRVRPLKISKLAPIFTIYVPCEDNFETVKTQIEESTEGLYQTKEWIFVREFGDTRIKGKKYLFLTRLSLLERFNANSSTIQLTYGAFSKPAVLRIVDKGEITGKQKAQLARDKQEIK